MLLLSKETFEAFEADAFNSLGKKFCAELFEIAKEV